MLLKMNDQIINYIATRKWILLILAILSFSALITNIFIYGREGGSITSDTIAYFNMAYSWKEGVYPISVFHSPGYPLFLAIVSYLLSVTIVTASIIIGYILYAITIYYTYNILFRIFELPQKYAAVFSVSIISFKQVSSILFMAHADAMMLCVHSIVLFYLFKFLKLRSKYDLILLSVFLLLSLWIKSNNILYFLYIPITFFMAFGKKDVLKPMLLPILSLFISYIFYKYLNGSDNARIVDSTFANLNIFENEKLNLFLINIQDYFITIGELFINAIVSTRMPKLIISILGMFFIAFFIFTSYKSKNKYLGYLLTYTLLYGFVFLFFQQMSFSKEVNNRTLITMSFSLFVLLYGIFILQKRRYFILLIFIFFMNTSFVLLSNYLSLKKQNNETVKDIDVFSKRKSVPYFKDFIQKNNITPSNTFTNQRRLFSFAMDCDVLIAIPGEKYFHLGKMVEPDSAYISKVNNEIHEKLKNGKGVVVLFDVTDKLKNKYLLPQYKSIMIDNDILIYK
jgi:hypothetical protein